ncbi:MAG: DsrE/DsrF/DrsH-like family protein [Bacteroidales bacterium]
MEQKFPIKKVSLICAKGSIEDVYASLIMANGAVMEGIETNLFFTFFGMDAIIKTRMDKLHTAVVGNPALRLPGGMRMPTLLGVIPGMESLSSKMMKSEMEKLDIPPVSEFLDLITSGGGKIYACKTAVDMFKLKKEDLSDHVSGILTIGEFYEHAGGEGSQIIFT